MDKIIDCVVVGIKEYGIFCNCEDYSGLLHISEVSDQYVDNIYDIFTIGDELKLFIIEKDEQYKKLRLSYKKSHPMQERIIRHVSIKKGFTSLKRQLNTWIADKLEEKNWYYEGI